MTAHWQACRQGSCRPPDARLPWPRQDLVNGRQGDVNTGRRRASRACTGHVIENLVAALLGLALLAYLVYALIRPEKF